MTIVRGRAGAAGSVCVVRRADGRVPGRRAGVQWAPLVGERRPRQGGGIHGPLPTHMRAGLNTGARVKVTTQGSGRQPGASLCTPNRACISDASWHKYELYLSARFPINQNMII
jgi:hypothetical protein